MNCQIKNIPFNVSVGSGNKGKKFPINPASCMATFSKPEECYFVIEGITDPDEYVMLTQTPQEKRVDVICPA